MTRTNANLLMLLAGLLWGGGFIAQQKAMDDIGPFLFIVLRFSIAALAIVPLAVWEQRKARASRPVAELGGNAGPPKAGIVAGMTVVSLCFFATMGAQQVGLLATTVTNAGMLTGLYVVLVPIICFVFLRQYQPLIVWPCAAAATLGIWMLGGGSFNALTWGDGFVLIGAIFAALHVIAIGHYAQNTNRPVALAIAQFAIGAVLALIAYLIARVFDWQFEPAANWEIIKAAMPSILYAAIVAGAAAFTLMAICQQYTPASDAAVLLSSEALFAALGGALLLGERLSALGYLGCAILFAAIVVVSFASAQSEPLTVPDRAN